MTRVVDVYPDPDAASNAAADSVAALANGSRARRTLVISGGRTPERLFAILARRSADDPALRELEVFFADERAVPPTDARSNYGRARQLWFDPAGLATGRVHRIEGERPVEEAADRYDGALSRLFGGPPSADRPGFDLALLGVGDDGHTASIFPGMPLAERSTRWAVATAAGTLPPAVARVTLTRAALSTAREAIFLVTGPEKRSIVGRLLGPTPPDEPPLPASSITARDRVRWILDAAAAGAQDGRAPGG